MFLVIVWAVKLLSSPLYAGVIKRFVIHVLDETPPHAAIHTSAVLLLSISPFSLQE